MLRNRYFWLFIILYVASSALLMRAGYPAGDLIASLVILGILLPLLALATCWRLPQPGDPTSAKQREEWMLVGLLLFITLFLAFKHSILELLLPQNVDPRLREIANTLIKLIFFVAIPAAVLYWFHHSWPNTGERTAASSRIWLCFLIMSAGVIAVQLFLGSQVKRLFGAEYSQRHLLLGLTLCFAWMVVEAGVVEEFFFRWLLQSRIFSITRSQVSAIFLMALMFGLAHAPGIWLRGGGAVEGLGENPTFSISAAYCIATQGIAGLLFGVLWARTRSLALVIFLHAVVDAPANAARFMDLWHL